MTKTAAALLAAAVLGATSIAGAPAASALPPTMGEGAIVGDCKGKVVDSGQLTDEAGTAHPTAHWELTRIGKDGTTYCFQVFSGTTERVGMALSITKDGGGAYERSTYVERTPGVTVYNAKGAGLSFSGSLDEGGTTWSVERSGVTY